MFLKVGIPQKKRQEFGYPPGKGVLVYTLGLVFDFPLPWKYILPLTHPTEGLKQMQ